MRRSFNRPRHNTPRSQHPIGLCMVLHPHQLSIGYMGDGFTGQKTQPTVSK